MSATLPPDVWVPVPLRWRHVVAGDVFVAPDGSPWVVARREPSQGLIAVQVVQADDPFNSYVDPDDVINVLVPAVERDAVELTREQLGARLIERRVEQE